MRNSEQLYELIHSLTKSEKRHFKILSSLQSGNKKYIELFNLIEKQKQYDERKLKLRMTALPVMKNYLYNLILKSLRLNNTSEGHKKNIMELIENAENLLRKGLYRQSYNHLMKAKKLAQGVQNFSQLIEIYQLEHVIANTTLDTNLLKTINQQTNNESDFALAALSEQFEYRKAINLLMYRRSQRGKVLRTKKEKSSIENKIYELLTKKPNNCLSNKGRIFHYNLGNLYHYSGNNFNESYQQSLEAILFLESDMEMLRYEMKNYISAMHNLMNSLMQMKRYEEMMHFIDKMRHLPIENPIERSRIFIFTAGRQVIHYTFTGQVQKGIRFITETEKEIPKYMDLLSRPSFYALCGNIEEFHFVAGNFKEALRWNNKMLLHDDIKSYFEYYTNARMAEIIIQYELGNFETCNFLITSYSSFLKKNQSFGKLESTYLMFFKQLSKPLNEQKRWDTYILFLNENKKLFASPYEIEAFDFFDIQAWLLSKIEGKSFSEILTTKSQV